MVTLIGTELALPTVVANFLRLEMECRSACRVAIDSSRGPNARTVLRELSETHELHSRLLRGLAQDVGAGPPWGGTGYAASRAGRIRLAHRRGGDRAVLTAIAAAETDAIAAYGRILRGTALPAMLRPAFERAHGDLARQGRRLDEAAREAA